MSKMNADAPSHVGTDAAPARADKPPFDRPDAAPVPSEEPVLSLPRCRAALPADGSGADAQTKKCAGCRGLFGACRKA